ncbi:MAG: hypothetical protein WCP21_23670, partial [Armatimonadota bacterium]
HFDREVRMTASIPTRSGEGHADLPEARSYDDWSIFSVLHFSVEDGVRNVLVYFCDSAWPGLSL